MNESIDEAPTPELAEAFWADSRAYDSTTRDGGTTDAFFANRTPYRQAGGLERSVYSVVSDIAVAGVYVQELLELLAVSSRTPEERAYIGTVVLEDAIFANGQTAKQALFDAQLTPEVKAQILAGCDL